MTLSSGGANFGGGAITQAPSTGGVEPSERSFTEAVTGPSETSSNQLLLFRKLEIMSLVGDWEVPKPPRTISRASVSVRISPSGTVTADLVGSLNTPVSK